MQLIKLVQLGRIPLSSSLQRAGLGSDVEVIEFDNATDFHNEYSLSLSPSLFKQGVLTNINDALLGRMLTTVPVSPMTKLLVFRFSISKDNRDYRFDFGRGMGPCGSANFTQIDRVELS